MHTAHTVVLDATDKENAPTVIFSQNNYRFSISRRYSCGRPKGYAPLGLRIDPRK